MAGQQRVYKQKIRATSTLKKVFRAMELIAASRITKARQAAQGQDPYTRALIRSISMVASHASSDHPLVSERQDTNRVAVLVVTSDRGMAGAYSSSVLREAEALVQRLRDEGKEPVLYVTGRRGESFFKFRRIEIEKVWSGFSDSPTSEDSAEIADTLLSAFLAPEGENPVQELHVVFTRFVSMVSQVVQVRRMLPLEVVDADDDGIPDEADDGPLPLYEFEPSAQEVFDALLPMYVSQRIHAVLLMSAASELAARQQAMHSATENAEELIRDYTRLANNARQAEITTEITELISGADALASAS